MPISNSMQRYQSAGRRTLAATLLAVSCLVLTAHAQTTEVLPGTTISFGAFDDSFCDEQTDEFTFQQLILNVWTTFNVPAPKVNCDADEASGSLRVRAGQGQGFYFASDAGDQLIPEDEKRVRLGSAVGRIGKAIRIPELSGAATGAEVLAAQISTEVDWSGLLWLRRLSLPAFTQVVATLQVRDVETGLVVASNTFLNERVDLEQNVPADFINGAVDFIYGWTTVRNSSAVDLTAQLVRGRDYRVEVEAKCEDETTVLTLLWNGHGLIWFGGGCFFSDASGDQVIPISGFGPDAVDIVFDEGFGFDVGDLTVTVQDDAKAKLAEALNQDDDGDGLPNHQDACPQSDLSSTVVIDGCDSGVENAWFANGCTVSDKIAKCAAAAGNHGQFVSCVAGLTNDKNTLLTDGTGIWKERGPIQKCAANAQLP